MHILAASVSPIGIPRYICVSLSTSPLLGAIVERRVEPVRAQPPRTSVTLPASLQQPATASHHLCPHGCVCCPCDGSCSAAAAAAAAGCTTPHTGSLQLASHATRPSSCFRPSPSSSTLSPSGTRRVVALWSELGVARCCRRGTGRKRASCRVLLGSEVESWSTRVSVERR